MTNLYVTAVPPADLNRNTEWFMYPGIPGRTWSLCFVPCSEHKTCTANTLIDLVESLEWITLHEVFVELFLEGSWSSKMTTS
ncbi:hypothetical protein DKX38_003098 [Salix brachista]|uniref:Uncharacterized protein n=1 Tax=Salix brachista TaxID=2182728 RepID=A0A5N5NNZ6_9ROSI|nr:hypothetical protein DKX38_003098 [Salix brachista]